MSTATADVGQAALWRLLSLGFTPPTAETVAEVEALAEGLAETEPAPAVEEVLPAVREQGLDALTADYSRLFGGVVAVAPYEGSYEAGPLRQGRQLADVAGFYRAFGAEAGGPASDRPDHAGCELEFLSFLELRRLAALDEGDDAGAELVDQIASSFLREHAGRWLPTFFAGVRAASSERSLYRALAALGAEAIAGELERRGLECEPLPRRRRLAVERDGFACG
jgi:TorA maturation chaperone TorD